MIRCRVASSCTSSLQLPARNSTESPPLSTGLLFAPLKVAAAPKRKGLRVDAPPRYNKGVVLMTQTMATAARRGVSCASHRMSHAHPGVVPLISPTAAAAIAEDFYASLNNKNYKRLYDVFAEDCVFEDLSFTKPFKGEEVHQFLKSLTEAMGVDVKFIIDSMFEGKESSIAVRWHLEWQQKQIPFATGCTFFYCSTNMGKLLIERACVLVESPVKPGGIVLEILKIVSSMFDRHPEQAKWFLERPLVLIQFITKTYTMLIMPLILPLWKYNTRLATYGTRILSYTPNLLQTLFRILN